MDETKQIQRFYTAFTMGCNMIKNIEQQTSSLEYRKIWIDILNSFNAHKGELEHAIKNTGVKLKTGQTCMQKMATLMQKMKLKGNDDFELLMFGIEGMQMGMIGIFKFLYVYPTIDDELAKKIIEIYDIYERYFHLLVKRAKKYLEFDEYRSLND